LAADAPNRAQKKVKQAMKKNIVISTLLAAACLGGNHCRAAIGTLSGPITQGNLQVFLIHGRAQLEHRRYATLSEALDRGLVQVRETGNVNELSIENLSKDVTVFLNAGDIVKGGRQDRAVRDDLVLPPFSGEVPLSAFCVEHGRWTQRGRENATAFSSNTKALSSRREKLAARYDNNQSYVWAGVAEQQSQLNQNLSRLAGKPVDVRAPDYSSSLQLALEDKDLDVVKKRYEDKLGHLLDGKTDVIGFLYAINGEINSAEVYNNKALFRALWPKLIDAAMTEALTECTSDKTFPIVSQEQLRSFFQTAVSGAMSERQVWKSTRVRTFTTDTTVLFETQDLDADGLWIHKTFIQKERDGVVVPLDSNSQVPQNIHRR
jgi:hypothetical protein